MAKIVCRQMPAPRELSQQIPTPGPKARTRKPQGGGNFFMQIPGVHGGMVMDEIDTCITFVHLTSLTFASFLCTSKIKEALQVALTSFTRTFPQRELLQFCGKACFHQLIANCIVDIFKVTVIR